MGDGKTYRHRVFVEDTRGDGSYLRATWHPERRAFVVSTWQDDVCTGAVRMPVGAAGELVRLLVDGLTEAASMPSEPPAAVDRPGARDVLARLRSWIQRLRLERLAPSQISESRPAEDGAAGAARRLGA